MPLAVPFPLSGHDSSPASRGSHCLIRDSHERALSALEPLSFPSITLLPPVEGWSSTTLDLDTVQKALRGLVTIELDKSYPERHFYRCSGLSFVDGGSLEDGCGFTPEDALMAYMKHLMNFGPADFIKDDKRIEWMADHHRFHQLG